MVFMAATLSDLKKWYTSNENKLKDDLFSFLRFKSISTDPSHKKDSLACADFLLKLLKEADLKSELIETPNYPLVYAENLSAGPNAPTVLLYGHYDVQPVDPLELWESDPFEPKLVGKTVFARGAQDNKGQIFYSLMAVKALLTLQKKLPVNLKICIEGEEESASVGFTKVLPKIKDKIKADVILVPDFDIPDMETPAVTMGMRGIVTMELVLKSSNSDLHSGQHGGIVLNPNRALVDVLSGLWDKEGKVQIPKFYEDVVELSPKEKKALWLNFDEKEYQKEWGVEAWGNEHGYSVLESNWIRPTLEVNGLGGGYFGKGFKTVIPAKATAKISCRLVPNQDPQKILTILKNYLKAKIPKGIKAEYTDFGTGKPVRTPVSSAAADSVASAYTEIFNKPCQKILTGGSVPIIGDMVHTLNAEAVMFGVGLDTDRIHAPNEHFSLDRVEKGYLVVARILQILGDKTR